MHILVHLKLVLHHSSLELFEEETCQAGMPVGLCALVALEVILLASAM
jgi:hypothetical protein